MVVVAKLVRHHTVTVAILRVQISSITPKILHLSYKSKYIRLISEKRWSVTTQVHHKILLGWSNLVKASLSEGEDFEGSSPSPSIIILTDSIQNMILNAGVFQSVE